MITSQSTTIDSRREIGSGALTRLGAAMKRPLVTYTTWRIERSAIAALRSMSDRALADIGLTRSEITSAVRRNAARTLAFGRER